MSDLVTFDLSVCALSATEQGLAPAGGDRESQSLSIGSILAGVFLEKQLQWETDAKALNTLINVPEKHMCA